MDNIHVKILPEIVHFPPKSFASPVEVDKKVKLDEVEFVDRLSSLRRLRYVTVKKAVMLQPIAFPMASVVSHYGRWAASFAKASVPLTEDRRILTNKMLII